jgi:hypothetical protein
MRIKPSGGHRAGLAGPEAPAAPAAGGGSPILDVVRINFYRGKIILVAMLFRAPLRRTKFLAECAPMRATTIPFREYKIKYKKNLNPLYIRVNNTIMRQ